MVMAAVVSESFARQYWPGQNAVGQRVRRVLSAGNGPWMTVVGVIGDVMDNGLGTELEQSVFGFQRDDHIVFEEQDGSAGKKGLFGVCKQHRFPRRQDGLGNAVR